MMPRFFRSPTPSRLPNLPHSNDQQLTQVTAEMHYKPRKCAREILTSLLQAAKNIILLELKPKLSQKLSKKQQLPPQREHIRANINISPTQSRPVPPPKDGYRVASASQLNGRLIENMMREEQKPSPSRVSRVKSLWHGRPKTPHPSRGILLHSNSTPVLTDASVSQEELEQRETPSPEFKYSPRTLSTIVEQTEPESMVRPISEVLSIGEARMGCKIRFGDYENSITRFAAKAIHLITELGPSIEVYARRQCDLQREKTFDPCSPEYFQPYVTKLFTRCCLCDINIQGDPIKVASQAFQLGSAALEIGACQYLNLPSHSGHDTVLRTEYDMITKQTTFIAHFCAPLCDEATFENQYTLVSQIDVTEPLRRLALQELSETSTSHLLSPRAASRSLSSQLQRFLAFIYWLGAYHSNAICFAKPTSSAEPNPDWQLRFASRHLREDLDFVPSAVNTVLDYDHMARAMDQENPFVQAMLWGAYESTTYLQYFVPVTDGRVGGTKWWVSWLVDKQVPGFWGKRKRASEELVEYPFYV